LSKDFLKIAKYNISLNPSNWIMTVPCGWTDGHTDRHDKANTSRFPQFFEGV